VKRITLSAMALIALAVLTACGGSSFGGGSALPFSPALSHGTMLSQDQLRIMQSPHFLACPAVVRGEARCYSIFTAASVQPHSSCLGMPECYGPPQLQAAYGVTTAALSAGTGQTIAAVDAFGYTGGYAAAASDLAAYRSLWGLPACGAGCFTIVNQTGGTALPKPGRGNNAGWQGEEMLDIDMISAMCPNCNILLVQAKGATSTDLVTAEVTALKMANAVSNSWGAPEQVPTFSVFDTHPGKVVTASAGDGGAGVAASSSAAAAPEAQPCGFQGVVCVGGTSLMMNGTGYGGETVWQDFHVKINGKWHDLGATGSGCSAMVAKPSWQTDRGCKKRSATDISANADPLTGVVISCTPCAKMYGLTPPLLAGVGGTSEASPIIAAMYGLAGNAATLANPSATIWGSGASNFHDITKGFNDRKGLTGLVCKAKIAYICKAKPGYDGPTGWGSPNGLGAL
jgi:subtilase family serine protease